VSFFIKFSLVAAIYPFNYTLFSYIYVPILVYYFISITISKIIYMENMKNKNNHLSKN
jgi:hypothetical protein